MSDTETDNTDEPSKAELHDRVRELESTVEKLMPSRRDALRLGAAGIAGAAGLSATTQPAEASTGSAGQIGDSSNRPDLFADTVDANQLSGSAGFIKTKTRAFLSSDSSADPIPFDSVTYDPDNNFDTTTNEYTVPADGTYQIAFSTRTVDTVAAGNRAIFRVNNNGLTITESEHTAEGNFTTSSATDIRQLTSGDVITVENFNQVTVLGKDSSTFLSIVRVE